MAHYKAIEDIEKINEKNNMNKTVFFTIVAKNYISYARTLCKSIAEHHPDARIIIGLSDRLGDGIDATSEQFEIIEAEDLDLPNFEQFSFRYDVMEFSTAIKPYMFRWIFANTDANKVVYLDPDILVVSPLHEVMNLLEAGASAVLTPHLTSRIDDSFFPNENNMLQVGVYNLGFIALSRHPEAHKLVEWWCDRLERGAIVDLANGFFTDQKWADLMPCLYGDVAILRDPGYNAAYWNLMHRHIRKVNGDWLANDRPLAFFHFSGVDPRNPDIFSKHQDRFMLADIADLKELYNYYVEQLAINGYFETRTLRYSFNYLSDGSKIHAAIRSYYRKVLDGKSSDISNPFTLTTDYFNEIETEYGKNSPVTRFMSGLFKYKAELQKAFDLNSLSGQYQYANWFVHVASNVYAIEKQYTAPVEKMLTGKSGKMNEAGYQLTAYLKQKAYMLGLAFYLKFPTLARKLIQWLPEKYRQGLRASVKYNIHAQIAKPSASFLENFRSNNPNKVTAGLKKNEPGVTLVGYVAGDFGVAENLRSVAGCLAKADYPFDIYEIDTGSTYSKSNLCFQNHTVNTSNKAIQLYCVNADQMHYVQASLGGQRVDEAYRIGYWFWELSNFPAEWMPALDLVDEIWAPSKFIFDSLSKVTNKPLFHMPVAVDFEIEKKYERASFDLPEEQFLFLVSFDFHSFSTRKNSAAVIEAFKLAFPTNLQNVGLVVKTIHGEKHPEKFSELLAWARGDNRIHVLNKALTRDEMYGLINVCDSYVSLHRAEGFGLGLAEAMFLGKPVIGTAYSGNMDFMTSDNSCLVDYEMISVKENEYPCWNNQVWAEPNIKQASEFMSKIYTNPELARNLATRGQSSIKSQHSTGLIGEKIKSRLNLISNQTKAI